MKKLGNVIVTILLAIWQLPQLLVALVMLPFVGKLTKIASRHHDICFMGEKMLGGISLGPISIVSPSLAKRDAYVAHELDGHTVDSKRSGPLYLFIVGIPSILNAWLDFTECYYDFYTERWANKHAGLKVIRHNYLVFDPEKQAESK